MGINDELKVFQFHLLRSHGRLCGRSERRAVSTRMEIEQMRSDPFETAIKMMYAELAKIGSRLDLGDFPQDERDRVEKVRELVASFEQAIRAEIAAAKSAPGAVAWLPDE